MHDQDTTTEKPWIVGKASPETASAARELIAAAKQDFDSPPFGNIMASWSGSGVLLVIARGDKAARIAAFLECNEIAVPDGHAPEARLFS